MVGSKAVKKDIEDLYFRESLKWLNDQALQGEMLINKNRRYQNIIQDPCLWDAIDWRKKEKGVKEGILMLLTAWLNFRQAFPDCRPLKLIILESSP